MATVVPKISIVFKTLFRADITTQWRNRRGVFISLLIPVLMVVLYKDGVQVYGGTWVLAYGLSYGLVTLGLVAYSNSIARDRDKGVFQRLRVAPIPTWAIMGSRLLVQLLMIVIITLTIFIVGYSVDHISLSIGGYVITVFTSIVGAAFYLSVGQLIVALIKNPDTVNATSRFVFIAFIVSGAIISLFDKANKLPPEYATIFHWTPYSTINTALAAGMVPSTWDTQATDALLATVGYIFVFLAIGIKKFTWESK
jgi:ABC-2 type transport system permease protein